MTNYIANFDYEYSIFKDLKRVKNINEKLEYLFFWSPEKGGLYSQRKYPKDYLLYIESITKKKCYTTEKNEGLISWWGNNLDNQKLNSRIKTFKANDHLGLNPTGTLICSTRDELVHCFKKVNFPFLLKEDASVSGNGTTLVYDEESFEIILSKKINLPVAIQSILNRKLDLGLIWDVRGEESSYLYATINKISPRFSYLGGSYSFKLKDYLRKEYAINIDDIVNQQKRFLNYYLKGSLYYGFLGIDCFLHGEEKIIPYCTVEVNARKTMSVVLHYLSNYYKEDYWVYLIKINSIKRVDYYLDYYSLLGDMAYCKDKMTGAIILGPAGSQLQYVLIDSRLPGQYDNLKIKIEQLLSDRN